MVARFDQEFDQHAEDEKLSQQRIDSLSPHGRTTAGRADESE